MESNNKNNYPSFILGVNNEMATMPISYANYILGDKKNLYRLVSLEGYYLPEFSKRCITSKYLFKVIKGEIFRIKSSDINNYSVEREIWTKIDLVSELQGKYLRGVELGFEPNQLPDKRWLLNVVFSLDSQHIIFVGSAKVEKNCRNTSEVKFDNLAF
jgi:hypothetical protein